MYFDDRNPPPKAYSLVIEWAKLHKEEVSKEWELAIMFFDIVYAE